ncbi:hypothetical protein IWQ61_005117 [Dispira simplex]|nr:hypothetical protein IWQ61_005117 [Dispira simplex]
MAATIQHCTYCFDVLLNRLQQLPIDEPALPDVEYPLFVTWNLVGRTGELRLRGCIGTFSPQPLREGLKEFALTSALKDRRFSPITNKEVHRLSCSVSLLTHFEPAKHLTDWEVGVHGIWIEFQDGYGHRRTATYLPEVAAEQGWSKLETIDSLLRKGGFQGRITDAVRHSVQVTRYQSEKTSMTYKEYLDYKNTAPIGQPA